MLFLFCHVWFVLFVFVFFFVFVCFCFLWRSLLSPQFECLLVQCWFNLCFLCQFRFFIFVFVLFVYCFKMFLSCFVCFFLCCLVSFRITILDLFCILFSCCFACLFLFGYFDIFWFLATYQKTSLEKLQSPKTPNMRNAEKLDVLTRTISTGVFANGVFYVFFKFVFCWKHYKNCGFSQKCKIRCVKNW